ncbi:LuxR C-terminal-related transcriptional regulator [Streptomyces sp. NPDC096351]|uniref:helix-turn-helix transcriptional regulator n=1 Tax=Streptomyces sp. NPDC096351 TaxID=3366087 RepID=UPI00380B3897
MAVRTMAVRRARAQRRTEQRDTLLNLLARLGSLTAAEQALLVEYTTAELAASDELRRTVQGEQRALQAALDRTRAAEDAIVETEEEVGRLKVLVAEACERAEQAEAALDALTRERMVVEVLAPDARAVAVCASPGPSPAGGGPAVHPARVYARRNLSDPRTYVTARQREVLLLAAHGNTNRAIGHALGLVEASVASHMLLITRKLRVRDRAQAVAVALAIGVLSIKEIKVPEDANRGYRGN